MYSQPQTSGYEIVPLSPFTQERFAIRNLDAPVSSAIISKTHRGALVRDSANNYLAFDEEIEAEKHVSQLEKGA